MKIIHIKQGDAYAIPIAVKLNGEPLNLSRVAQVEFMLGHEIRLTYPREVAYSDGVFLMPLTQTQTLAMGEGTTLPLDVRVCFQGGDVLGAVCPVRAVVVDAVSGEVM